MANFDKYLQYRALSFAFSVQGSDFIDALSDEQQKAIYEASDIELKFVNVPFPKPTVERLEGVLCQLGISKRDFVQRAVVDAIQKAEAAISKELNETGVFDKEQEEC